MKYILLAAFCLAAIIACESRNVKQKANNLGNSMKDTRVVGGVNVTSSAAYPYQVSIQNIFDEHVCGGSIINEEWILTAAHCMEWPKEYLVIATGTIHWKQPRAMYNVSEVFVHCLHDKPMYHNDIALIRLSTPIIFDNYTRPVTLPVSNPLNEGDKLTLTGWGSTKKWGAYPDTLQKVELEYYPNDKCATKIRNSAWLGPGHICTFTKVGEGSCHGDSGGPLVHANGTQYGIVNFGEPCAVGIPDAFASVAYYYDWIRTTMSGGNRC